MELARRESGARVTPQDIGATAEKHNRGEPMSATTTDAHTDTWDDIDYDLRFAGQTDWADRIKQLRDAPPRIEDDGQGGIASIGNRDQ